MDYAVAAQLIGTLAFIVSFFGLMAVVIKAQFASAEETVETQKIEPSIDQGALIMERVEQQLS